MAWLVLLRNSFPAHFFLLLQACLGLLLPVCSALMMFVSSPPSCSLSFPVHFIHLQLLRLFDHPHHLSVSSSPPHVSSFLSSAPLINSHPSFTTLVLPSQLLLFFLLLHPIVNHFLSFCSAYHPAFHHLSCFWVWHSPCFPCSALSSGCPTESPALCVLTCRKLTQHSTDAAKSLRE